MKNRFLAMAMVLVMIAGLFVMPVSASDYAAVPEDPKLNYGDSTTKLKELAPGGAEYTFGTGEGQVGLGTRIGSTNWRLRNAAETPEGMGYVGETTPVTFGVNASGYLRVKARPATGNNLNNERYNTNTAKRIPAIVLDTDEVANLSSNYNLKVEINRAGHPVTAGVRFSVHNNGQNYYALILNGSQIGKSAVELVKSVDGVVTTVAEFGSGQTAYDSFVWTEVTVNNGTISFVVGDIVGTYTDPEPFNVSGKNAGIWFMAMNAGTSAERYGIFRNIELYNLFTNKEPDMIFVNAAEGKDADDGGVLDLEKAVPIRRVLYSGEATEGEILVSKDKNEWFVLSSLADFADGEWANKRTSTAYRYIKADGIVDDLAILTDVQSITMANTSMPITLYPRLYGTSAYTTATITADKENVLKIDGTKIAPAARGSVNVTAKATKADNNKEYTVTIPVTVTGEREFVYTDVLGSTQTLSGLGNQVAGTNWRMRNAAETPDGLMTFENGNAAKYGINSDGLFVDAMGNSVERFVTAFAKKNPSLVLTKDLSELSSDHKISVDFKKVHQVVTPVIRFMVHNGGKDYYALVLGGTYYEIGAWELVKSVDGVVTQLMKVSRGDDAAYSSFAGNGTGWWNIAIAVTGNTISFTATDNGDATKKFSGTYTDVNMFDVSGNDCGVWLSTQNGNNNESRYGAFKNFKIENYIPYIGGYEPAKVVYTNAAEGRTPVEGVITLGSAVPVRRIEANGSGAVAISNDGSYWLNIGELEDGKLLNTITEQKVRYVKVDAAATDVKVLTEVPENYISLTVGDGLTLYPYFDGIRADGITLSSSSGKLAVDGLHIKGMDSENNIKLTATNGDDSIELVVDVVAAKSAEFSYTESSVDTDKLNFTVKSAYIKGETNTVIIAYYREDNSLISVQVFSNVTFANDGTATFTADKVELPAGAYGKGYIWNNISDAKPVTSACDID